MVKGMAYSHSAELKGEDWKQRLLTVSISSLGRVYAGCNGSEYID